MSNRIGSPPEIVFFDLETTVPNKPGDRFCVLEFGAIVLCPMKLVELDSFCTLIRPHDLSAVAVKSGRCNGITRNQVAEAPAFGEVADKIFSILDGKIWAGHNIQRFDCARIKEAFADINRSPPNPSGIIDSLGLLSQRFGRRAGNMKMATLAAYFGLGQQQHRYHYDAYELVMSILCCLIMKCRSLEDVRMNLEVLKHCATVLLLESSLPPNVVDGRWQNNSSVITRSKGLQRWGESSSSINKGDISTVRRKSTPLSSVSYQRAGPYSRVTRLGKVASQVKNLLENAKTKPLSSFLKHSQSLIR